MNLSGEDLKNLAGESKLKGAEIARRMGVTPQSLISYFKTANPKDDVVHRFLEAIGKNLDEVYKNVTLAKLKKIGGVSAVEESNFVRVKLITINTVRSFIKNLSEGNQD